MEGEEYVAYTTRNFPVSLKRRLKEFGYRNNITLEAAVNMALAEGVESLERMENSRSGGRRQGKGTHCALGWGCNDGVFTGEGGEEDGNGQV